MKKVTTLLALIFLLPTPSFRFSESECMTQNPCTVHEGPKPPNRCPNEHTKVENAGGLLKEQIPTTCNPQEMTL